MCVCVLLLDEVMKQNVQVDKVARQLDVTHCSIFSTTACQKCVSGFSSSGAYGTRWHISYPGHIFQQAEGEHESSIGIILMQLTRSTSSLVHTV